MKEIRIRITEEEYELLKAEANELTERLTKEYSQKYRVNFSRILEQFVADLTSSENSGGSDERNYIEQWFYRSYYNF